MTTYVPPHLRNKTKTQNKRKPEAKTQEAKTQEVKITEKDFPELVNTSKKK